MPSAGVKPCGGIRCWGGSGTRGACMRSSRRLKRVALGHAPEQEAPRASPPAGTGPAGAPRAQAEARRFLGALAQRCQAGGGALVSAAQLYALADALELAVPDTPAFIAELNDAGARHDAAACASYGPACPRSSWARSQAGQAGGGCAPVTSSDFPSPAFQSPVHGSLDTDWVRAVDHDAGLSTHSWRGLQCMLWLQRPG